MIYTKSCRTCLHKNKSSLAEVCLDCYDFLNWRRGILRQPEDREKGLLQALIDIQECCNGYTGSGPLKTINEIASAAITKTRTG